MTQIQPKVEGVSCAELEAPRVENFHPQTFAGLRDHYTNETCQNIPALWQRFAPHLGKIPGQIGHVAYGLCSGMPEGFDYMPCVEVSGDSDLPSGFSSVSVPARKYVVFAHRDHVAKLRNTMDAIWQNGLAAFGHDEAPATAGSPNVFERYGEKFDPQTGLGDIEIWIPIKS